MPGKPASAKVGTAGSAALRRALETAKARSLPALIWGRGPEIAIEPTGGSPATTATTAGPAPRKWIGVMLSLPTTLKRFSPVRCGVVPLPGEAYANFEVLARLKNSARVFAGRLAFTKIMLGGDATAAVGMKSRSAS